MKRFYAVLAFVICGLVALQAAFAVWADAGLFVWISAGGAIDQATLESAESSPPFPEVAGFMLHGMNGMMVIPVVALVLLVVSFFAKVPKGIARAVGVAVLVALQVTLGILGHSFSVAGLVHGLNALLLFTLALLTGLGAWRAAVATVPAESEPAVV